MASTSDSIGYGESGTIHDPDGSAYSAWRNRLTAEQGLIWTQMTPRMSTKERIKLWNSMIRLPKSNIALDFDLILVQPAANYDNWKPTDVLICRKWADSLRKQVVYSPEGGFCSLLQVIRA